MPEEKLTPFGARIEHLRKERGFSKQGLASRLGVSRQHVWRVMRGEAEFSADELRRLATVFGVPGDALVGDDLPVGQWEPEVDAGEQAEGELEVQFRDYISNTDRIMRTLRNMPAGPIGRALKELYLDGVVMLAREAGERLPANYWDLRRQVHEGEL